MDLFFFIFINYVLSENCKKKKLTNKQKQKTKQNKKNILYRYSPYKILFFVLHIFRVKTDSDQFFFFFNL